MIKYDREKVDQYIAEFEKLLADEIETYKLDSSHEMVIRFRDYKYPVTIMEALPIRLWKYGILLKGKKYTIKVHDKNLEYYEYNTSKVS